MDRILNIILRRAVRRIVGKGVDAGVERATRGGASGARAEPTRAQRDHVRKRQRSARQAMRLVRRFSRF
jgi:hypothetical protein